MMSRLMLIAFTALALSACAGEPSTGTAEAVSSPNSLRCVGCLYEGYGDRCAPGC